MFNNPFLRVGQLTETDCPECLSSEQLSRRSLDELARAACHVSCGGSRHAAAQSPGGVDVLVVAAYAATCLDDPALEDCILLDAVQKGHRISADNVVALLERGLLEGDVSEYHISLDVAKKTRQLPEYTRNKGLDKSKIQQMILQYLQNAGSTGAKRDAIFDYLKEVLPQNKTHEQQERMLGNILSEMKENGLIVPEGRTWFLKS